MPFVIFVIAATAELNRPPFDLVEAEQELVGGFHTEYSSIRFALFFLAEFMNTVTMSAIIVTLFLGGPQPPFKFLADIPGRAGSCGIVWFFLKLWLFLYMYVWFRATLPRFRYDQLMDLGWKLLIPASFGWLLLLIVVRGGPERGLEQRRAWSVPPLVAVVVMRPVRPAAAGRVAGVGPQPRPGRDDVLMGYLGGFAVTARQSRVVRRQARHHRVLGRS